MFSSTNHVSIFVQMPFELPAPAHDQGLYPSRAASCEYHAEATPKAHTSLQAFC